MVLIWHLQSVILFLSWDTPGSIAQRYGWLGQLPGEGGADFDACSGMSLFLPCFGKRQCPITASRLSEIGTAPWILVLI